MTIYLDASVAVPLVAAETHSASLVRWWAAIGPDLLTISPWVTAEVVSALSLKLRTRAIDLDQRARAQATWSDYCEKDFASVAIKHEDFEAVALLCSNPSIKLRAPDALHLAVAQRAGLRVATLDRDMLSAAIALGIRAFSPLEESL